jgi:hypothetical protein
MLIAREATKECLQTHFTQRSPNPLAALQNGFWWRKNKREECGGRKVLGLFQRQSHPEPSLPLSGYD